jgi:D-alanyl-D-alanine carboxypeptidase
VVVREGVQRAEYGAASDRNRAALQAQLLQQGFGQAQQLAGQAFGQQQAMASQQGQLAQSALGLGQAYSGLGQQQLGFAQAAPQLAGQQIAGLTTLGGLGQAQQQAQLICSTTISSTTIISTIINCTAIWFRNHGFNIRISWSKYNTNSSFTYSISKYIRCRCNTCWNI